jgi:hypothetical protein
MTNAWIAKLAATYPAWTPPAPEPEPEPGPFDDQIAADFAAAVHDFEGQLGRPLEPHELAELGATVAGEYQEAINDADTLIARFDADLFEQTELLERDLGRRLLAHEHEGIREQGLQALTLRGEALDAEKAWENHWRHHNTATGESPPDMTRDDDVTRYMAARAAEMAAHAEMEAETNPTPTGPDPEAVAAAQAARDAEQAKRLEVPLTYGATVDEPLRPDWSKMTPDQVNQAMAARLAGGEYVHASQED